MVVEFIVFFVGARLVVFRCPAANQKWAASVHAPRKMADRDQEGPGETGEDTDELLYSDVEAEVRGSGPAHARPPRDHCDLLLDAIDAQLSRLQAQSHVVRAREDGGNSKRMTHNSTALGQSQSVSKDTGFGSTLHTNATSTPPLDVGHSVSETPDLSSEKQSGSRGPDSAEQEEEEEEEEEDDGGAAAGEAEEDSERKRCLWRLERLLGRAEGGYGSPPPRREDSVRTEDFAARFREEMLEPLGGVRAEGAGPGSGSSGEEPAGGVRAEGAGPGGGAPLGLCEQSTQAQHSQLPPPGGDSEQSGDTASEQVELSQGQPPQGCKKRSVHQESRPIGGRSVSMTALTDSTPLCVHKRPGTAPTSDGTNWTSTPHAEGSGGFGSAPGPPSSSGTGVLTASRSSVITAETEGVTGPPARPAVRHLAGVPVKSFDSVTIDSDLDSVRTDRVREHFRKALRCGAAVRCAQGNLYLEDLCTDQSDPDLLLEPRSKFSLQALRRNVPDGSRRVRAPHNSRRGPPSAVVRYDCSNDEETDEEEEAEEEEEQEHTGLSGLDHRGLVQKNSAPWRRRPGRLRRPHLRTLTGGWLEAMSVDRLLLEEALHALRQNCLREEERLKQKREQLHDTELSLTTLLQQKKHALQELEYAQERAEQAEREGRGLEASLRDSRTLADSTRSQLRVLQAQRDAHAQELRDLEEELIALRRHKGAEAEKLSSLCQKLHASGLSVLEREELDRQLDSAKTELFAERRRARHKLDSLQERLEETQQELEQCGEEVRVLRASHMGLEEELTAAQRQREDLEQRRREEAQAHEAQVQELQGRLGEHGGRVGALERLLAQQEVRQQEAQEQLGALQEEKRSLEAQLLSQREEHLAELRETQEQARRRKELELEQLRSELSSAGQQEVQQVLGRAEAEKREALKEQALSHAQRTDALRARVQLMEEELRKLTDALERQEEAAKTWEEELRKEAQETVRQALDQERRKWEAQKGEELRVQQEALEEQGRRAVERMSEEAERERRNSLALQNKIVELQTRMQEQESDARLQQREHAAALTAQLGALRDEQQDELQQLRRQLEQEAQREVSRLQLAVQEAQEEAQALRAVLSLRRGRSPEEGGVSRAELQQRGWATEMGAECQRLQELLEHCGATGGAVQLPHNPTVAQVAQTLRSMREQLYTLVSRLQQDLDTQRHKTQQLARDKERELRTQSERLTVEREQALDSLKERLIQEHIEELSSMQRTQLRDSSCEPGGVVASLRRQLQEKDGELREVQRSMGRWKEQTATRLARKFEEELTAELERCKAQLLKERRVPRTRTDQQRKLQRLETEMRQLTAEYGDPGVLRSTSTPSLLSADPPAAPGPPDLATFKLLRHLQSRVRQLRAENSVQSCSPTHLGPYLNTHPSAYLGTHLNMHLGTAGELAGSYLETIGPASERCHTRTRTHSRTVPN
ncbi:trichohyalin [Anguilla anguilla]|uniref:trichohyalin n=1 Tax=Anguilla anguilla TaxID=7936 RepID=UPI0015B0B8BF|nr:trichohyalin [Anguilla anguilla]